MNQYVPLQKERHKNLRIKPGRSYEYFNTHHMVPVTAKEFSDLAASYPIIFIKDAESGVFKSAALFGFKPGQNFYYDNGIWNANYLPISIRSYPFMLTGAEIGSDELIICIDESCGFLSYEDSDGELLIDSNDQATPLMDQIRRFLYESLQSEISTAAFIKWLLTKDLLVEQKISLLGEEAKRVGGIYIVDRIRFNNISDDDQFYAFTNKYLEAIHAHWISLAHVDSLISLYKRHN